MENEKQLNSVESIALIQSMIAATQNKLEKGGGTILLIWGYTSLLVTALVVVLLSTGMSPWINFLFFLIPIIGYTLTRIARNKQNKTVTTYIDKFIKNIWAVTGIVAAIFPLFILLPASETTHIFLAKSIIPVEALILSIAVTLTGMTISFKPLIYNGIIAIGLALLLFYIGNSAYIFMALFVVSMIIPGHILNYRGKCSKN